MLVRFIAAIFLYWLSFVKALSFSKDFNGTIPSILGLTNLSYPTPDHSLVSGYADGLVNSIFHQPWPASTLGKRKAHFIKYCFADMASREALLCNLQQAVRMWKGPLGFASKNNGHSLFFIETILKGGTIQDFHLCYKEGTYDSKKGSGTWNYLLVGHQDALVIAYRPVDEDGNVPATASTVGYTREEYLFGGPPAGRHYMQIADKNDIWAMAHEIGHVFGLLHEHQRYDRDIFLEYRPQEIKGYNEALQSAISDGVSESEARTKLTDDYVFCQRYNFRGSAFVKNADQPGAILGSDILDTDSIMMYPSFAESASPSACIEDTGENISKCPLVKRAGRTPDNKLLFEHIWSGPGPSERDLDFVRKHYPWYDDGE